jgi:hypothetical protein
MAVRCLCDVGSLVVYFLRQRSMTLNTQLSTVYLVVKATSVELAPGFEVGSHLDLQAGYGWDL